MTGRGAANADGDPQRIAEGGRRFRQALDVTGFVASAACLAVKPGQGAAPGLLSLAGVDYWLGGLVAVITLLLTARSTAALIFRNLAPERALTMGSLEALTRPERLVRRLVARIRTTPAAWGSYGWRLATAEELRRFARWSDEDENIGHHELDRLALYRAWFAAEPRAFAVLTRYGAPVAGSIILPLNAAGVALLDQEGTGAQNLRAPDIGVQAPAQILLDTLVSAKSVAPSLESGYFAAALLGEHARLFLRDLASGVIWFEPDHRVFKALTRTALCRFRGSSPSGGGTWSLDLADARLAEPSRVETALESALARLGL